MALLCLLSRQEMNWMSHKICRHIFSGFTGPKWICVCRSYEYNLSMALQRERFIFLSSEGRGSAIFPRLPSLHIKMWIHIYGGQDGLNYIGGGGLGEHKCNTNNWAININSIHYTNKYIYIYIFHILSRYASLFLQRDSDPLWFCQQEIHADKDFRRFAAMWWSHANVSWPAELAEKKNLPLGVLCPCGLDFWILCKMFPQTNANVFTR